MSEPPPSLSARFALTPRQRRLRWFTLLILLVVVGMVLYAGHSPVFRPTHPAVLTPGLSRAIKAKIVFVGFYWIICFLLVALLPLLAWLDIRETVRKVATARRDYWREIAARSQERLRQRPKADPPKPRTGDGSRPA